MEYEIRGIRTSLPFFHWLLRQPAFLDADFHTEFLDELLQRRGEEGFAEVDPSLEEVVAIAACIAEAEDGRSRPDRSTAGPKGPATVRRDRPFRRGRERRAGPCGPAEFRSDVEGSRTSRGSARMTCELEIGGRRRTIDVRRHGSEWEITLDGRILGVDVTAIGERWSLLIGPPEGGPRRSPAQAQLRSRRRSPIEWRADCSRERSGRARRRSSIRACIWRLAVPPHPGPVLARSCRRCRGASSRCW